MRFAFLFYASRSGSTLLARLISEQITNIVVLPEFRAPEWLLSQGEAKLRRMSSAALFSLIKLDHQRANLGLADNDYLGICQDMAGANARVILEAISRAYLARRGQSSDPDAVLIKLGSLISLMPSIRKTFPSAIFIHIKRDPRGVVNSQIRSERPYFPGEKMGRGDAWFAAKSWHDYQQTVERYRSLGIPIHDVCYERLVMATDQELMTVVCSLGLSSLMKQPSNGIGLEVIGPESSIHELVQKPPVDRRVSAWREELPAINGCVIEYLTRRSLIQAGYELYFTPKLRSHQVIAALVVAYPIHVWKMQLYYLRRVLYYAWRWRRLLARIQLMVRRLVERAETVR
ncbi:hypothetical protein Noc_1514 [Nitrosococcus oceani ATCC 19707]|uniref:Sulfotransferase n=2 Tax=Nitrosococcus oceani TaxID=1229 RepID=Q3JAZ7_NITOC|nr:sulfotransferase [Nitrosococcus oceani]ABA57999.1 hypothetical protein Noc_1514 [Nitrosococcus oceani ATCC 19707]EDZ67759.1 hypothetical protein NOC27_1086 [Nitrosococcus oceani AFC27]KFI19566.1 hypothetical protein IB75_07955 [Nitrosococcus oceani C-27]GEM21042.1 sulfotransferase family protein [Nitrosococcus oceani]